MSNLRKFSEILVGTPLHPQWLMPERRVEPEVAACTGVVLDIGSASRWVARRLHPEARYIALDYPATAVSLYAMVPDVFADAAQLPFADAGIDVITCFEVLEHVPAPDRVLGEIARVLVPGGYADCSMPFLYPVHDAPYDFQRWTEHGWRRSAAAAGLEVVMIEPVGHPLHASAVLANLSLAGPLQGVALPGMLPRLLLASLLIPLINISAWVLSKAWPSWSAMGIGHAVLLRKPG